MPEDIGYSFGLPGVADKVASQTKALKPLNATDVVGTTIQAKTQLVADTNIQNHITQAKAKTQINLIEVQQAVSTQLSEMHNQRINFIDESLEDVRKVNDPYRVMRQEKMQNLLQHEQELKAITKEQEEGPLSYLWGGIKKSFVRKEMANDIAASNRYTRAIAANRGTIANRIRDYTQTTYMRSAYDLQQYASFQKAELSKRQVNLNALSDQSKRNAASAIQIDALTKQARTAEGRFAKDPALLDNPIFQAMHTMTGNENAMSFSDVEAYNGYLGSLPDDQRKAVSELAIAFNTHRAAGNPFDPDSIKDYIREAGSPGQLKIYSDLTNDQGTKRLLISGQHQVIDETRRTAGEDFKSLLKNKKELDDSGALTPDQVRAQEAYINGEVQKVLSASSPKDVLNAASRQINRSARKVVSADGSDFSAQAILQDTAHMQLLEADGYPVEKIMEALQDEELKLAMTGAVSASTGLADKQVILMDTFQEYGFSEAQAADLATRVPKLFYTGKAIQEDSRILDLQGWGIGLDMEASMDVSGRALGFFGGLLASPEEEFAEKHRGALQVYDAFDPVDLLLYRKKRSKGNPTVEQKDKIDQISRYR